MDTQNPAKTAREYRMQVENAQIRLLVDGTWDHEETQTSLQTQLHSHISAELFVCGTGKIVLKTEDGYITLYAGDAAVIPPEKLHIRYHMDKDTEGYAISFLCSKRSVKDCTELYKQLLFFTSGTRILVYRSQPYIFESVRRIVREGTQSGKILPVLWLTELLLEMLHHTYETEKTTDPTAEPIRYTRDIQRMMELDKLIAKEYMKDWNNSVIAEQLYISPRQLDRIALKRYGKTLHQVIMDKRIQMAEQLLVTTDMTVDKIAVTVGFSSSAGLYREFFRRYDTTPARYRENSMADREMP